MAGALGGGWPSPQADSFRAAKVMGRSKAQRQLWNTEGVGGVTLCSVGGEMVGWMG